MSMTYRVINTRGDVDFITEPTFLTKDFVAALNYLNEIKANDYDFPVERELHVTNRLHAPHTITAVYKVEYLRCVGLRRPSDLVKDQMMADLMQASVSRELLINEFGDTSAVRQSEIITE